MKKAEAEGFISYPPPKCSRCKDAGFVDAPLEMTGGSVQKMRCECHYVRLVEYLLKRTPEFIAEKLQGKRLAPEVIYRKNPPITDNWQRIQPSGYVAKHGFNLKNQQELLDAIGKNPLRSYALFGPTGTGKSFLLWALAVEAAYAGRKVIFRETSALIEAFRSSQTANKEDERHPDIVLIEDLKSGSGSPVHLFLDELDNIGPTDFALRKLFDLINHCYNQPSKVVLSIAANLTEAAFKEMFGPATYRRIEVLCTRASLASKEEDDSQSK
jgi:hypothetical protein